MDRLEMRKFLKDQYPNRTWRRKVDKMPDRQVYAIVQDILKKQKQQKKNDIFHHQYTLDEWMNAFQKGVKTNEETK